MGVVVAWKPTMEGDPRTTWLTILTVLESYGLDWKILQKSVKWTKKES